MSKESKKTAPDTSATKVRKPGSGGARKGAGNPGTPRKEQLSKSRTIYLTDDQHNEVIKKYGSLAKAVKAWVTGL